MTDESVRLAVDPDGLKRYFAEHLPRYAGDFTLTRLGEGQSCLTFMVEGDGWRVVLRRPPRGDLPPSAFDVTREYRVMTALRSSGSDVPTANPVALCTDQDVIGANFYLMEPVEGVVIRTEIPHAFDTLDERRRMCESLVDTLVALDAVDHAAAGLDGFGKPEGYLERQLRRMNQLWELAKFRDVPEIDEVGAWLAANLPPQTPRPAIVHGDYKLDNVILGPEPPARIVAVVDWEMSTIGDPLADLGWMLYFWRDPGDPSFGLRVTSVTDLDGFLRRKDILARYADATGADVSNVLWYAALAGWKIAIIMEGSYRRFKLGGITDHPMFATLEDGVPALARRAQQAARGDFGI